MKNVSGNVMVALSFNFGERFIFGKGRYWVSTSEDDIVPCYGYNIGAFFVIYQLCQAQTLIKIEEENKNLDQQKKKKMFVSSIKAQ
ncbi:uncharacterized protein isoform X2 [Leptinotarsa decemlineata]|uniref:uncharacterized protein isoform X2 n=1 Tax=Leptinotarsa decemlineata TaxID=7539 RepID=UPI003D30C930